MYDAVFNIFECATIIIKVIFYGNIAVRYRFYFVEKIASYAWLSSRLLNICFEYFS